MHTHSDYFGYVHSILTMLKHSTNYDRVQPSQPFFSAIYCSFVLTKSNRSSRPGVKSAPESTQPQINSAGSILLALLRQSLLLLVCSFQLVLLYMYIFRVITSILSSKQTSLSYNSQFYERKHIVHVHECG